MRNLQLMVTYLQLLTKKGAKGGEGGLQQNILVTGTKSLFADALVAFQGILIPIVLALFVFLQIQKNAAEENEESKYTKKQKALLIGLIIAELIGTLVGTIGGYYGLTIGG